jgi:hypothetical protein
MPPAPQRNPFALAQEALWRAQRPVRLSLQARRVQARGMNDTLFSGVLTILDAPSTNPPQGSTGKRVVIPSALAAATLHQLQGMPVNVEAPGLSGHEPTRIVGVLDGASIEGNRVVVQGRLWDKNQKDLVDLIRTRQSELGMSFEVSETSIHDESADPWVLSALTWTGCAILTRASAAYSATSIRLAA